MSNFETLTFRQAKQELEKDWKQEHGDESDVPENVILEMEEALRSQFLSSERISFVQLEIARTALNSIWPQESEISDEDALRNALNLEGDVSLARESFDDIAFGDNDEVLIFADEE